MSDGVMALEIKSCDSLGIGLKGDLAVVLNDILIVHWGLANECLDFYLDNRGLIVEDIVLKKSKKDILDINRITINDSVKVERQHE